MEKESEKLKPVPADWKVLMDEKNMSRCISRISYEILEREKDYERIAVVGIRTGGEFIGKRIRDKLQQVEGVEVPFGIVDITLYRDDLGHTGAQPTLKGTELDFPISGSRIILVDDVLYTGRTVRAALDAIIDFGRPRIVELAVLVDRGHRELPIRADYVGKNIPTSKSEIVRVRLREAGYADGVYVATRQRR